MRGFLILLNIYKIAYVLIKRGFGADKKQKVLLIYFNKYLSSEKEIYIYCWGGEFNSESYNIVGYKWERV